MPKEVQSVHRVFLLCGGTGMVLSWLIPNHYPPWVSFYNESGMAVALLFFALGVFFTLRAPALPLVALMPVVVIAIPWLQFAFGLLYYSSDAWVSSLYLLGISVAICVGYNLAALDVSRMATLLCVATLVAAIASSAIGLNQVLEGAPLGIWSPDMTPDRRAFANLAQPNNLATLLGFGVVALWYLRERGYLQPLSGFSILLLLILGIAATQSRTALLFGPAIVVGLWLISRRTQTVFKTPFVVVITATGIHWLLVWLWPRFLSGLLLMIPTSIAGRGLHTSRLQIWPLLIDAVNQHPWTGYGWLQVGAAQLAVAQQHEPIGELFSQAHNLFLDLVIFCGYPVGFMLDGVIVYWFVCRWVRVRNTEAICGMLTITVLGIHSMLELPHWYAYFLIPAALWLGVVECSVGSARLGNSRGMLLLLVATSSVLCVDIGTEYLKQQESFRRVRFDYLRIGIPSADHSVPVVRFLSSVAAYVDFYRVAPHPGMSALSLNHMQEIMNRYPYVTLMFSYSEALALNGRFHEAEEVFRLIRFIHGERAYTVMRANLLNKAMNTGEHSLRRLADSLQKR